MTDFVRFDRSHYETLTRAGATPPGHLPTTTPSGELRGAESAPICAKGEEWPVWPGRGAAPPKGQLQVGVPSVQL